MTNYANKIVGIDATNIRRGGGLTHLLEIIQNASPLDFNIKKVIIWSSEDVLSKFPDKSWLEKSPIQHSIFSPLIKRIFIQYVVLPKIVKKSQCDIFLVPGGIFINKHRKVVTISQNLLPFQLKELLRFGLSIQFFKLVAIHFLQKYSFSRSDGVIFLTNYAKDVVHNSVFIPKFCIINHGVSDLFKNEIRAQLPISEYNDSNLFRIIYVSTIDCYKHQIPLISAVGKLIESGYPVALDLVGPINSRNLFKRMTNFIKNNISDTSRVIYHGEINYLNLPKFYQNSNLAVFSSTCENMPNILLEKMAAGLPIACSKYGPMPEILGDAGLYYDPEDSLDIEKTLKQYLNSSDLRSNKAYLGSDKIKNYSWSKCSNLTFNFLNSV